MDDEYNCQLQSYLQHKYTPQQRQQQNNSCFLLNESLLLISHNTELQLDNNNNLKIWNAILQGVGAFSETMGSFYYTVSIQLTYAAHPNKLAWNVYYLK